jgi:hypothetical protein
MPLLGFNHSETASKQVELMADMQAKPFRGLYRTVAWAYVTKGLWRSKSPRLIIVASSTSGIHFVP